MTGSPSLVLQTSPASAQPVREIPLSYPKDCTFWSLTPAPRGPFVVIELQCAYGPAVQVLNALDGTATFLPGDPGLDSHLLGWQPDGKSVYLKVGTLSNPQVLRVDVTSRSATPLPISQNTYNLSVSQDGSRILYALSNGLGLGSEVWSADTEGKDGRKIMGDDRNILGLMRPSPDGKHIAMIRLPDNQSSFPAAELLLADADGKNVRRLAVADGGRGMPPVWSPDGQKMAFTGRRQPDDPNSINLSIYDMSTSKLATVDIVPATISPVWSPDNTQVYFTTAIDDKMEVWFYEMSNGKVGRLLNEACCAGWLY